MILFITTLVIADNEIKVFRQPKTSIQEKHVPDEIIVKFKTHVKDPEISKIVANYKTPIIYSSDLARFKRLKIPKEKGIQEILEQYKKDPNVEYAEPNYIAHALMIPNDPYYSYQWHFDQINMEQAWDISTGSGVVVAVIDTGAAYEYYCQGIRWRRKCYYQAPDLAGTTFVAGYDFVNNDAHPNDDESHGTHVTGTVAQTTNNNLGVAGVAFDASIMPIKVLDSNGQGFYSWIVDGIYYAVDHGAQIISLSLGGNNQSQALEDALAYAYNHGVTVIAAAGNDGVDGPPSYPAAYDDYVIAVAATRFDETRASYSTTGNYVDIAAPGGDVNVDQNSDGYGDGVLQQTFNPNTKNTNQFGYWFFQGTSMATPHVSAIAALLIANGITGPDNVRQAIQATAKDKGDPGWDPEYGYGIINAYAALQYNNQPIDNDGDGYNSDVDCDDNNVDVNPGATEVCNGIDDDCDQEIDEGFSVGDACSVGIGECYAEGNLICTIDGLGTECDAVAGDPSAEICDGLDNDCDTFTDEDLTPPLCEEQDGVCLGSTKTCGGALGWLVCDASNYGADYETNEVSCDDVLDNDCDGLTDSDDSDCLNCVDNDNDLHYAISGECPMGDDCNDNDDTVYPGAPDSACNGVNNDCDTEIDEDYIPTATECGIGACHSTGSTSCIGGVEEDSCTPGTPAINDASCNNIDDDCDGSADEDYIETETSCGIGACSSTGQLECQSGTEVDTCTPGTPETETCDGIDNDCDNEIDEGGVCDSVKCWDGNNEYLNNEFFRRDTNQFRKFCKCAEGTYDYSS